MVVLLPPVISADSRTRGSGTLIGSCSSATSSPLLTAKTPKFLGIGNGSFGSAGASGAAGSTATLGGGGAPTSGQRRSTATGAGAAATDEGAATAAGAGAPAVTGAGGAKAT